MCVYIDILILYIYILIYSHTVHYLHNRCFVVLSRKASFVLPKDLAARCHLPEGADGCGPTMGRMGGSTNNHRSL